MDDKIYITDAFYWRKEDFDKNIASTQKLRPPVFCAYHNRVVSHYGTFARDLSRQASGVARPSERYHSECYVVFKDTVDALSAELWRLEKEKLFIKNGKNVHSNKYTYPDFKYIDSKIPSDITCPEHGNFPQTPNDHLRGAGCPICGLQSRADKRRTPLDKFIQAANVVHDNRYTYPDFKYVNTGTPSDITCPWHGNFPQTPNNHLAGHGCPMCKNKTEGVVFTFLKEVLEPLGLKVEHMGKRDSKGVGSMDIRITKGDMTIYVEVDGEQHFKDVKNWKSKAKDAQASDLKKHIRATAKGHAIIRIDQVWVWESHVANKTEWSSRLRQTIVKLVSGVKPCIDELFLSNRPDKYFSHPCYEEVSRGTN